MNLGLEYSTSDAYCFVVCVVVGIFFAGNFNVLVCEFFGFKVFEEDSD